jgi:hypothetical protein
MRSWPKGPNRPCVFCVVSKMNNNEVIDQNKTRQRKGRLNATSFAPETFSASSTKTPERPAFRCRAVMTSNKSTQDAPLESQSAPERTADDDSSSALGSSRDRDSSSTNESDSNSRSGSGHTGSTDDDIHAIKEGLAREETVQVFRLRVLFFLVLLATAIAVSFAMYRITRNAQVEEFENEFNGVADVIIEALNGTNRDKVLGCWTSRRLAKECWTSDSRADHSSHLFSIFR